MESLSTEAHYLLQFINQTNRSVFLTGKAGTGKTTLLREIITKTYKNTVVVAPTGIAALNAGGVTIHSFFQLPFSAFIPDYSIPTTQPFLKLESRTSLKRHFKWNGTRLTLLRNLELLIIDEVSMLRPDILDAIDFVLQSVRRNNKPFGGVQVLFIGDLMQLPPIVKEEEWTYLKKYYHGKYFFHAQVLKHFPPLYIELPKIFRQSDTTFINLLNQLRNNTITKDDLSVLDPYIQPNFEPENNQCYITLTTNNAKADRMNTQALAKITAEPTVYQSEIIGDFPEKAYPLNPNLILKVGAQVMFVKNDLSPEKRFFNGKMGVVKALSTHEIIVEFPEEKRTIEVEKYEWQNIRYTLNESTKDIEEEVLGTFTHYPLKLAWAITVHKSQGLTFDKAVLDVSDVFLPGQAYVAFSRLRSLQGLVLKAPIQLQGIQNDPDVIDYASQKSEPKQLEVVLTQEMQTYLKNYVLHAFDWDEWHRIVKAHQLSYLELTDKSPKAAFKSWANEFEHALAAIKVQAQKFQLQLQRIFDSQLDYPFLKERLDAAVDYFYPTWESMVYGLLLKIEAVKTLKKVKEFYEELQHLETVTLQTILQAFKVQQFVTLTLQNQPITKENLVTELQKEFKSTLRKKVLEDFKSSGFQTVEFEYEEPIYTRKKAPKAPKKSTYHITFELWKQSMSLEQIAAERKLTVSTIQGHIAKLIEQKEIKIEEVLPQERFVGIIDLFQQYPNSTLSEIKEIVGETIGWEELKWAKAAWVN
ncbi:helix-turn-helix domain-containing protein [Flavobacterium sp.]|uniref:helix-turn-helix domain-containing protein n=1 Tax=Flavobacterium sp. TaxID=239 RepID=UPI00391C0F2B